MREWLREMRVVERLCELVCEGVKRRNVGLNEAFLSEFLSLD